MAAEKVFYQGPTPDLRLQISMQQTIIEAGRATGSLVTSKLAPQSSL